MLLTPDMMRPTVRVANLIDPAQGTVWGPREIVDWELVLVISGSLGWWRRGERVAVNAGDVLLLKPAEAHTLAVAKSPERTLISCIHFLPIENKSISGVSLEFSPSPREITQTGGDYLIRDLFTKCAKTFEAHSRYRDDLLSCVFSELWICLCEMWEGGGDRQLSARMSAFLSYIRRHLSEEVSRNQLAREFGVTPQHVNAVFKKELGSTPSEVINRERVYRAGRLLATEGLSVKEAAARMGFRDQFYFSRVFKRIMGYPPSRAI